MTPNADQGPAWVNPGTYGARLISAEANADVSYAKRTGEITVVKMSLGRELEVMRAIGEALERLDQPARDRVLRWARDKYLSWRPLSEDGDV